MWLGSTHIPAIYAPLLRVVGGTGGYGEQAAAPALEDSGLITREKNRDSTSATTEARAGKEIEGGSI